MINSRLSIVFGTLTEASCNSSSSSSSILFQSSYGGILFLWVGLERKYNTKVGFGIESHRGVFVTCRSTWHGTRLTSIILEQSVTNQRYNQDTTKIWPLEYPSFARYLLPRSRALSFQLWKLRRTMTSNTGKLHHHTSTTGSFSGDWMNPSLDIFCHGSQTLIVRYIISTSFMISSLIKTVSGKDSSDSRWVESMDR